MDTWNQNCKAILVGVTDYSEWKNLPDLPAVSNDLRRMSAALVSGLHIPPNQIWVRTMHSGMVTRQVFLNGVRLLLENAGAEDTLLFYFSGHGKVAHGTHYLLFSDGALETQSVIDLFSQFRAEKRILLLDCCYSGLYELPGREMTESWIDSLLSGGTAVFASGRAEELSGYQRREGCSLFTAFLWNAVTNRYNLQNGQISLEQIRELVYRDAKAWNENHPEEQQHPVFRSNMGGTVFFRITDDVPYKPEKYTGETPDYMIDEVSPLHSQKNSRLVVKVILKHAFTESELIRINRKIVHSVRFLKIYRNPQQEKRWRGRPASLVFIYYGYDEADIALGRYAYRTIWAKRPQDREHWYQKKSSSKILRNTWICSNPDYRLLRGLAADPTMKKEELIRETKNRVRPLLDCGYRMIHAYQEFVNGSPTKGKFPGSLQEECRKTDQLYLATSDLPVPPPELANWCLLVSNVAGDIQDFSCILSRFDGSAAGNTGNTACIAVDDSDANRTPAVSQLNPEKLPASGAQESLRDIMPQMDAAIRRFHQDLYRLQEEEKQLNPQT